MFAKSSSGGTEGERREPADDLETLKNLGPVSAARLKAVGIETPDQLRQLGAAEAYLRLKRAYPIETTQVALYAIHGAILGMHWYSLTDEVKARLREEVSGEG